LKAAERLEEAYRAAKAIDLDYLETSNPELPVMYSKYFVEALSLWNEGFSLRSPEKIAESISSYNEFLLWMQSQDGSDFKPLR